MDNLGVVTPLKRSRSLSPVDISPASKKSRIEDDDSETVTSLSLPDWNDSRNNSNDSASTESIPEVEAKAPSPVNVIAIDFDSVIAGNDDSEDDEVEAAVPLNTTVDLSEESSSSSESSVDEVDEVEVIKEKEKPEPKRNRRKAANQRRNIKELIGHDNLDVATLAAQKEEWLRRERVAQKQKSLGMSTLPLSMEQIMERFSSASSVVSMTQIVSSEADKSKKGTLASRLPNQQSPTEHEVLTLSSDDEDCVPCYESSPPSQNQLKDKDGPPPLLPLPRFYDSYVSDSTSSRSRYSGGTMIINNSGSDVKFENDDFEENCKSSEDVQEDDDDDCIVLSPPPPDAVDESEKDEDAYNVPDDLGRVLVNVGHPPEEPDIFLAPLIAKAVKPHQIGGIRFMYDNVVESLERYNNSPGFGCILAHSMGLGKTIQAAAFCDVFLNHTGANTVLVIVPINTIQNWLNEFNFWLPATKMPASETATPNTPGKKRGRKGRADTAAEKIDDTASRPASPETSHSSGEEGDDDSKSVPKADNSNCRNFEIFLLNETVKNLAARGKIIADWSERRGVLLIGYEMYRMLALKKLRKTGKRKKSFIDLQDEDKTACEEEATLDRIYSLLVDPGPDLVICDEGHKIKNSGASISQALKAIRTRRRIVLTGYPLQNNLMEYHCMCDFIRPNYLGNKSEFANMFERPIINGQCIDSTVNDKRLMQFRSHVLHSLVEGFVQRRSHLVLQRALPRKEEWVFLVKMSPIQTLLYKEFITHIRYQADMGNSPPNPIKAFAICCKIWNHPDVLYNVVAKRDKVNEQAVLEDLEDLAAEVESFKRKRGGSRKRSDLSSNSSTNGCLQKDDEWGGNGNSFSSRGSGKEKDSESALSFEWSLEAFKGYVPNVLENGTKFELLFNIIEETVKVGDKLLVFSQSLLTLNLMEIFIGMKLQWVKGKEYFRLDGSTTGLERERLIKEFNSNAEIHVFLVSTRAGSLGINLIGANRVVVFDASWNPCHDCQAVCRIYRYGQKKRCQIYRFVTDCTLEKKIYDRQITKRGMANRVVDEMNPDAHFSTKDLSGSLLLELDDLVALQDIKVEHDSSRFDDPVVLRLLSFGGDKITKAPFEHESLLIDRKEKKLSKAERRLALRNYEMEKKSNLNQTLTPTGRVSHAAYMQNNYTRADYDHQVPVRIAPAPPGFTPSMKAGFKSGFNPMYRQNNNFGQGKGVMTGRYSKPSYLPSERVDISNFGLPRNISQLQLKKSGISVQLIILKKDSFLADPDGGPDIYLMHGQRVYLFRSNRGTYLKLANGRLVAVRNRLRGGAQNILDTVPPSQELTKEQASIVIHAILRPRISTVLSGQEPRRQVTANRFYPQNQSKSPTEFGSGSAMPSPLSPSSYLYGDYQNPNQHNLQITNHRNSSGGDVTIWRKESSASLSSSSTSTRSDSFSGSTVDGSIPDIEVIKINPNGENERIEPTQLESELFQHQPQEQQHDFPFNSFPPYMGSALDSPAAIYPPVSDASSIVDALGRSPMLSKYQDPYYPSSNQSFSSLRSNSNSQHLRNTQSPLEQLRNTVSQLPTYKLPDDLVMDYVSTSPKLSNPSRNSIPDSLYSKLLKSQEAMSLLPPPYNPQPMKTSESSLGTPPPYGSHNFYDSSIYTKQGLGMSQSNNVFPYYTNGGSVSVNEKPAKSIFTPVEQEILDRHRKELL